MYCKLKRFLFLDNFDNSGDFEIDNWNSKDKAQTLGVFNWFRETIMSGQEEKNP